MYWFNLRMNFTYNTDRHNIIISGATQAVMLGVGKLQGARNKPDIQFTSHSHDFIHLLFVLECSQFKRIKSHLETDL